MSWNVQSITTAQGALRVIMPDVISVSRATDVPAFYGDWYGKRWEEGYCEWQNPFNARQIQHVSFKKVKAAIFWSKSPAPFLPWLARLDRAGIKYYFQFTLNDYEREGLEPGVPPLSERVACFRALAERCPVIWRYDPVVFGAGLEVDVHMERIASLMKMIGCCASKLVFSFVDLGYRRAKNKVARVNSSLRSPSTSEMLSFAAALSRLREQLAPRLELASCGTDVNMRAYHILPNRCIDPELLERLYQGACGCELLPDLSGNAARAGIFDHSRDRGQRKTCACSPAKDIGSYRMACLHRCVYCYAGHGA